MATQEDDVQHLPGVWIPEDEESIVALEVTPLMLASYRGDVDSVRSILDEDSQCINRRNVYNATALHYAVDGDRLKVVDLLLAYGADPDETDLEGQSILHWAVVSGCVHKLQACLNIGVNINLTDANGDTALIMAAKKDLVEMVQCLIENGCHTKVRNRDDLDAADCAFCNNNVQLQTFIENSMLEIRDNDIGSAMLQYCQDGEIAHVQVLVSTYGTKLINFKHMDFNFETPLLVSCKAGNLSIAQLLKNHGANMNVTTTTLKNPLIRAAGLGHMHVVKWLVSSGARVNARSIEMKSAIHYAITNNNYDIVECLVENGALLNFRTGDDYTAAHYAVRGRHINILDCLLRHGVPADITRENGVTPMLHAVEHKDIDIMRCLVQHGADVNRYDHFLRSPLYVAVQHHSVKAVEFLVEHGADVNMPTPAGISVKDYASHTCGTDVMIALSSHRQTHLTQCRIVSHVDVQNKLFQECENLTTQIGNLQELLRMGADINCRNNAGKTPLIVAVEAANVTCVEWLVERQVNINETDSEKRSPLVCAVLSQSIDIVNILLKKGSIDIYHTDVFEYCICDASNSSPEILNTLLLYGKAVGLDDAYIISIFRKCIDYGNIGNLHVMLSCLSEFRTSLSPEILVDVCLCQQREIIEAFLPYILQSEAVKCSMEFVVQLCLANECHNTMDIIGEKYHNVSKFIFAEGNFWSFATLDLVLGITEYIKGLTINVVSDIFRVASKCGFVDVIQCLLDAKVHLPEPAKQTSIQVALEHGHYEVAASIADDPVIMAGISVSEDRIEQHPISGNDKMETLTSGLADLMNSIADLAYDSVVLELIRNPLTNLCYISRGCDGRTLTAHVTDGHPTHIPQQILSGASFDNIFDVDYIYNNERAKLLSLPCPTHCHILTGDMAALKFLTHGSGLLLEPVGSHNLTNRAWVVTTADVAQYHSKVAKGQQTLGPTRHRRQIYVLQKLQALKSISIAVLPCCMAGVPAHMLQKSMCRHVYTGPDDKMLNRRVTKIGLGVDREEGAITDVNVSFQDQAGHFYHGAFVVSSVCQSEPCQSASSADGHKVFARPGDGGAAVADKESGIALGLLVASTVGQAAPQRTVTFCLRLDYALQALSDRYNLMIGRFRTFDSAV